MPVIPPKKHEALTNREDVLSNDFFINLTEMSCRWKDAGTTFTRSLIGDRAVFHFIYIYIYIVFCRHKVII